RPMRASGDLDFSFSGLKTAVMTHVRGKALGEQDRADIARAFQDAVVDVLVAKSRAAIAQTGLNQLVVAGGVGANRQLRAALDEAGEQAGFRVVYPELELCTDNGAMIALAGALRLVDQSLPTQTAPDHSFTVRPRWDLASVV
ncbi:MAG: tRNA (adenosine(37)-N6)-threonylcarbamoyltransferase complex transferase subunit TsaD, partial [Burkholderiales bacterium]